MPKLISMCAGRTGVYAITREPIHDWPNGQRMARAVHCDCGVVRYGLLATYLVCAYCKEKGGADYIVQNVTGATDAEVLRVLRAMPVSPRREP